MPSHNILKPDWPEQPQSLGQAVSQAPALGGASDPASAGADWLRPLASSLGGLDTLDVRGRIVEVVGTLIKATGVQVRLGELCELRAPGEAQGSFAEVIGFVRQNILLVPLEQVTGLSPMTEVIATGRMHDVPVGQRMLGRVIDGLGRPLDGQPLPPDVERASCQAMPPNPLARKRIDRILPTGVRMVDTLMTVGAGQRVGLFAPAGVGKSTLLGMLARGTQSDVNVIALIGERGREVREFLEETLGPAGLAKSVVVTATSDRPALERAKAAYAATAIAEHFRQQGKNVLLLMDSLTRFARAQREIGLAAGEPPTRRGYPPSIFAELPRLLERAGCDQYGSITAFYTVLTEGEDVDDPIAEEVRSILDGHIVMSRKLAEKNYYPAIDPLASLSRLMSQIVEPVHQKSAGRLRMLEAKYREVELLLQIGEYQQGTDRVADEAIASQDMIRSLLNQGANELTDMSRSVEYLVKAFSGGNAEH